MTSQRCGCQAAEYSGKSALDFLARTWPGLYERDATASAHQDPSWLLGWARQLPSGCQPLILAVLDRNRPVAALALVRETARDGSTRITPLAWAASEQVRPVGESGEAMGSLIRHLPHLADRVLIAELPHGSPLDRQAEDTWGRRDIQTLYATIPLPVDLAGLSRSTRRDHVRRRRDVQALGDRIGYRRTRTRAELLSAYDALEALYRRRNALRPHVQRRDRRPPVHQHGHHQKPCGAAADQAQRPRSSATRHRSL